MLLLWELKYWILFIIVVLICLSFLLTDSRFSIKRKLIFCLLMCVLFVISLYIEKAPYLIIKDLFWYSLILNTSFIFHVIIMSRLFDYYRKRNEYVSFLISRTSFFLSLSNIIYLILIICDYFDINYIKNIYLFKNFGEILYFTDKVIKSNKSNKSLNFYKKYLESSKIKQKIFFYLLRFIFSLLWIVLIILLHFSMVFNNYSLILLGINKPAFNLKNVVYSISFFSFFLLLSIIIGIPRLYIIWMFQLIIEIYKTLTFQYIPTLQKSFKKENLLGKIKKIFNYSITFLLEETYKSKFKELSQIYEKPYHKLFMFDLCKFLLNKYEYGECSEVWGSLGTIYENYDEYLEYPIRKVYKFHKWEDLAIGYCIAKKIWESSPEVVKEIGEYSYLQLYQDGLKFSKLINFDEKEFINKLFNKINPDIKTKKDFEDYLELIKLNLL